MKASTPEFYVSGWEKTFFGFSVGMDKYSEYEHQYILFLWEHLEVFGIKLDYRFSYPITNEQSQALKDATYETFDTIVSWEDLNKSYEKWKYKTSQDMAYQLLSNVNHKLATLLNE